MKLLFQSLFVFFGTLIAAAVVALGEPVRSELVVAYQPPAAGTSR